MTDFMHNCFNYNMKGPVLNPLHLFKIAHDAKMVKL